MNTHTELTPVARPLKGRLMKLSQKGCRARTLQGRAGRLFMAGMLLCVIAAGLAAGLRFRPAAVVDGRIVWLYDVDRRIALFSVFYGHQTAGLDRREARRQFTDMLIDETLLLREAADRRLAPTQSQVEEGFRALLGSPQSGAETAAVRRRLREAGIGEAEVREFVRRQETANLLIAAVTADVRVTDEEVADYYNRHKDEFQRPEIGKFSLIRLMDKQSAERALAELRRGRDFAALAREVSVDPATRSKGGDVGWVYRGDGRLSEAVEAAAFSLRPGQVSGALYAGPGAWLLVRMEEYRPARQFELNDVRMELQAGLVRQKKEELFETFRKDLRSKASITIFI